MASEVLSRVLSTEEEEEGGSFVAIYVVLALLFLFVALFVSKGLWIVKQSDTVLIERFGQFQRSLQPGINWTWPFIENPRSFQWNRTWIDENGRVCTQSRELVFIDLRENAFNFQKMPVYTRDTVMLDINSLMYYRIFDAHAAVYNVDDLQSSLMTTAQAQMKEIFGALTFAEALTGQKRINETVVTKWKKLFASWGLTVTRFEILEMSPKGEMATSMKKQMISERHRRSDFLLAEGRKTKSRIEAEGVKQRQLNIGIAEQEALRKRSEGESQAKVELAQAESLVLKTVSDAVQGEGSSLVDYNIAQKFNEFFREMGRNAESKTVYLPYQARGLGGLVDGLSSAFGRESGGGAQKGTQGGRGKKAFSELD